MEENAVGDLLVEESSEDNVSNKVVVVAGIKPHNGGELLKPSGNIDSLMGSKPEKTNRVFPFLKTFLENQRSDLTRQEYHRDLQAFGDYLVIRFSEVHHPRELTRHHLIRYKFYLEGELYSPATISRRLAAISAYFRFLAAEGIIDRDICYGVKRPPVVNKKETAVLTNEQVRGVLGSIPLSTLSGLLHHALLSTLFGTGMRGSAIRHIRLGDISDDQGHKVVRVTTKGQKKEIHLLRPEVWDSISRYVDALRAADVKMKDESFIFQAPPKRARGQNLGSPITTRVFNDIFKQYCLAIGLKDSTSFRYSPHSGRSTFATRLNEAGVSVNDLQAELGHASIQTTMKYIKKMRRIEDSAALYLPYFADARE